MQSCRCAPLRQLSSSSSIHLGQENPPPQTWPSLIYVSFNLSAEAPFNIACKFNRAWQRRCPCSEHSTQLWLAWGMQHKMLTGITCHTRKTRGGNGEWGWRLGDKRRKYLRHSQTSACQTRFEFLKEMTKHTHTHSYSQFQDSACNK